MYHSGWPSSKAMDTDGGGLDSVLDAAQELGVAHHVAEFARKLGNRECKGAGYALQCAETSRPFGVEQFSSAGQVLFNSLLSENGQLIR